MLGFATEKKLFKCGYKIIAGVDEAGRGSLAGPVVAACVTCFLPKLFNYKFPGVDDSKKLTEKERNKIFEKLISFKYFKIGIGIVNQEEIDQTNILKATYKAMRKSLFSAGIKPEFILVDGRDKIPNIKINQKSIIKGDKKIFLIAAASIIAKVTRDVLLIKYHNNFPNYCFNKNKGYGTREHISLLSYYGPCPLHRKSFSPVKQFF